MCVRLSIAEINLFEDFNCLMVKEIETLIPLVDNAFCYSPIQYIQISLQNIEKKSN